MTVAASWSALLTACCAVIHMPTVCSICVMPAERPLAYQTDIWMHITGCSAAHIAASQCGRCRPLEVSKSSKQQMQAAEQIDTPAVRRAVHSCMCTNAGRQMCSTTAQQATKVVQASQTQHDTCIYTPAAHRAATGEPTLARDPACLAAAPKLPESAAAPPPQLHAHEH